MNRWMYLVLILAGVAMIALAVWLDFRDGSPTTTRGDQPIEVVIAGGFGIALLGNGLYRLWKSLKRDNDSRGTK